MRIKSQKKYFPTDRTSSLRSASGRSRPSEKLAPPKKINHNKNQPIGDLSELTKKQIPFGSVFRAIAI
jgi:hypothetical protein